MSDLVILKKCLNEISDDVEDEYERNKIKYSKNENLYVYYCRMPESGEENTDKIDNKVTKNLFEKYGNVMDFDSDSLINDKISILECV